MTSDPGLMRELVNRPATRVTGLSVAVLVTALKVAPTLLTLVG